MILECNLELGSKYCFYCLTQHCPFYRDFDECLNFMDQEQIELWHELTELRSEVVTGGSKHTIESAYTV